MTSITTFGFYRVISLFCYSVAENGTDASTINKFKVRVIVNLNI